MQIWRSAYIVALVHFAAGMKCTAVSADELGRSLEQLVPTLHAKWVRHVVSFTTASKKASAWWDDMKANDKASKARPAHPAFPLCFRHQDEAAVNTLTGGSRLVA